ncbi:YIP1 family protein [Pararhodobacter sp. SW119]|uniref:YIP1 family protein n=1 Tax=Pararhodobacter sp. SW119 TaxID=2780075 RepID=UPI001AE07E3F|nr:YIP1 family protein [Pararhodobacter sp. SW119]
MSLSTDILRSYRAPRLVVREQLAAGRREDRVLVYLMLACVLIFFAQWPGVTRAAQIDPSVPLQARIGGALMGVLFVLPLLSYALALFIWLALRLVVPVSAYGVRLALFWAVLAITPLMLVQAALSSALGASGGGMQLFGFVVLAGFLFILFGGLRAALEAGSAAA